MANGRLASTAGSETTSPVSGLTLAGKSVGPISPSMAGVAVGVGGMVGTAVGAMVGSAVAVGGGCVGAAVAVGNKVDVAVGDGMGMAVGEVVGETAVGVWHATSQQTAKIQTNCFFI